MKTYCMFVLLILTACGSPAEDVETAPALELSPLKRHHKSGSCVTGMASVCVEPILEADCTGQWQKISCDTSGTSGACLVAGVTTWRYSFPGGYGSSEPPADGAVQGAKDQCDAVGGEYSR